VPAATSQIAAFLTPRHLRGLAGSRFYERGDEYYRTGRVTSLVVRGDTVRATVRGSHDYRVSLAVEGGDFEYDCTCPLGDDDLFCKHCVAVGLAAAFGEPGEEAVGGAPAGSRRAATMDDVRAYLERQPTSALVELLVSQAAEDGRLMDRLRLRVAGGGESGPDVAAFRAAIDDAVRISEYEDMDDSVEYGDGVAAVLESVAELVDAGHGARAAELVEYALAAMEEACGEGDVEGALDIVAERAGEIHEAACRAAPPDPEILARRLFRLETESTFGAFHGAAERYADVLGERGLAEYRRLAREAWDALPPLGPGEHDPAGGGRWRITAVMKSLAAADPDPGAMLEVITRDLSVQENFLEVALFHQRAGDGDLALEWAERGIAAFGETCDPRLRDLVLEEYHRRGRGDDAMMLLWAAFDRRPDLQRYQVLKGHANRLGTTQFWRERALARMRSAMAPARPANGRYGTGAIHVLGNPRTELVRILMGEGDLDAAWAEAQGGVPDDLVFQLARLREKDHPEDAFPVYRKRLEELIEQGGDLPYGEAVRLLRRLCGLMDGVGQYEQYEAYERTVRDRYRRKRNFMKLLDGRPLG
jgi:uncharacterized Zn finger protein